MTSLTVLAVLFSAALGVAFGWLIARTRAATEAAKLQKELTTAQVSLEKERQSAVEKLQVLQTARDELKLQFEVRPGIRRDRRGTPCVIAADEP